MIRLFWMLYFKMSNTFNVFLALEVNQQQQILVQGHQNYSTGSICLRLLWV